MWLLALGGPTNPIPSWQGIFFTLFLQNKFKKKNQKNKSSLLSFFRVGECTQRLVLEGLETWHVFFPIQTVGAPRWISFPLIKQEGRHVLYMVFIKRRTWREPHVPGLRKQTYGTLLLWPKMILVRRFVRSRKKYIYIYILSK